MSHLRQADTAIVEERKRLAEIKRKRKAAKRWAEQDARSKCHV